MQQRPVTLESMARHTFDRALCIGTWLALVLSIVTGILVALADSARSEVGVASALAFMVLFFFVSAPLHVVLAVAAVVRGVQAGIRPVAWVCVYLVLSVAAHAVVGERMGAFESLERKFAAWTRERGEPAQVALERALRPPGDVPAARAAMAAGADPEAINPNHPVSSLVLAARQGNVELVDALLLAGADPDRRVGAGMAMLGLSLGTPVPLDAAAFSDSPRRLATVERLLAGGASPAISHLRLGACYQGDLALLDAAIAAGAPETTDEKGNTCMHAAALRGHPAMVRRLTRDGVDPNAVNRAGIPPLDGALGRRRYAAALALAEAGARSKDAGRLARLLTATELDEDLAALQAWVRANPR